jgi:AraC family transcriptional activator of pyochelin receptor
MSALILVAPGQTDLWRKLAEIQKIDPTISGGIDSIVYGRTQQRRGTPIPTLFSSGYEEIHEIEPGLCAHITDAVIDQDWRLTATGGDYSLRLRIAFAGEAGYEARQSHVSDESARCSFMIRPPGEPVTANFKGGVAYRYCSLSMTQSYLRTALELADGELPSILLSSWSRGETVMGHFPMSKPALTHAGRFFNMRFSRGWHKLAVRALALDLLRILMHDWQNARPETRMSIRITQPERARLLKVRDQIDADPGAMITLATLSAQARMNRNKLHFGFKQQFGVSIHEYQTELRMREAWRLLETTELPISEIAERTGYQEPTNFTAAFKKHFAVLPRQARGNAMPTKKALASCPTPRRPQR